MFNKKVSVLIGILLCSVVLVFGQKKKSKNKKKDETTETKTDDKPTVAEKVKGSQKIKGLFTMYQDSTSGSVKLYISKAQFEKEYIYQSFSMGGPPALFLNQNMLRETWVFSMEKNFDKIQFTRQNTNYYYDSTNAISKAANVDVSESIFYSEKIVAEDANGYLIEADGLFISEKLDPIRPTYPPGIPPGRVFKLGKLSSDKSSYIKLKSYPSNTDVVVNLAYENGSPSNFGGKDITDARNVNVKMQHSFLEVPENNYRPRYDDPRVGYFTQEVDDMTTTNRVNYKDLINRWHLEKKDPNAALSEPVEPIVWWLENTTPVEIRDVIMQAGLKWNESFEKAGFKNAIVMKQMPDSATWDPADIRYNVLRWVSSDLGFAIGPSFVNPRTGQILGADITFDYGMLTFTVYEDETFTGIADWPLPEGQIQHPYAAKHLNCTIGREMKNMQAAAMTMVETMDVSAEELKTLKDQFLTELVLHEMGHTLGLNHNMKASTMLSPAELNDTSITRELGLIGSVMDYSNVNINSDKSKQGDYYTTKAGPYDHWAIEFGYRQFTPENEAEGIAKILSRSTDPQLTFGNDADIARPGSGVDPRVMVWDMSSDVVVYAQDRFKTINYAMSHLKDRFVKSGESYANLRSRYYTLNGQRAAFAMNLSTQIGGIHVDRSFPEQKSSNKPFTPVPTAYQKRAMQVLAKNIFAPDAFAADAELYAYLQRQRRGYNFWGGTEDPKILSSASRIQNAVLDFILHPVTLSRSTSTTLYGTTYSNTTIICDLVKAWFNADMAGSVNPFRQTLQTTLVQRLLVITADKSSRYETAAESAAYYSLKNLKASLNRTRTGNEQTKAHRSHLVYLIDKGFSTSK
jgi:hypothetical protein